MGKQNESTDRGGMATSFDMPEWYKKLTPEQKANLHKVLGATGAGALAGAYVGGKNHRILGGLTGAALAGGATLGTDKITTVVDILGNLFNDHIGNPPKENTFDSLVFNPFSGRPFDMLKTYGGLIALGGAGAGARLALRGHLLRGDQSMLTDLIKVRNEHVERKIPNGKKPPKLVGSNDITSPEAKNDLDKAIRHLEEMTGQRPDPLRPAPKPRAPGQSRRSYLWERAKSPFQNMRARIARREQVNRVLQKNPYALTEGNVKPYTKGFAKMNPNVKRGLGLALMLASLYGAHKALVEPVMDDAKRRKEYKQNVAERADALAKLLS